MYMGELVRLLLVRFTKEGLLFGGKGTDMLYKRGNFFTKYVSEIESDREGDFTSCRQVKTYFLTVYHHTNLIPHFNRFWKNWDSIMLPIKTV